MSYGITSQMLRYELQTTRGKTCHSQMQKYESKLNSNNIPPSKKMNAIKIICKSKVVLNIQQRTILIAKTSHCQYSGVDKQLNKNP